MFSNKVMKKFANKKRVRELTLKKKNKVCFFIKNTRYKNNIYLNYEIKR